MEVLKKGRKQRGYSIVWGCMQYKGGCGASLLISEFDLYRINFPNGGFRVMYCCPECGLESEPPEQVPEEKIRGRRPSQEERDHIALKDK